jgi:hypothetical protein
VYGCEDRRPAAGDLTAVSANTVSAAARRTRMAPVVGFIGLGNMGRPMALNVVKRGLMGLSFKDQELETAFGKELGVPLPLANVSQQVYQMARAAGLNKEDGSAIVRVLERMAGVHVGDDDARGDA